MALAIFLIVCYNPKNSFNHMDKWMDFFKKGLYG